MLDGETGFLVPYGDGDALSAIAKKYNADDTLVVAAAQRSGDKPGLDVTARRYRAGQLTDTRSDSIDANPGEKDSDFFRRAADANADDGDAETLGLFREQHGKTPPAGQQTNGFHSSSNPKCCRMRRRSLRISGSFSRVIKIRFC